MTVAEYERASRWLRLRYRFYRNPLVLFLLGPVYVFLVEQRVASFKAKCCPSRKLQVVAAHAIRGSVSQSPANPEQETTTA
jgi:hypothetical protein